MANTNRRHTLHDRLAPYSEQNMIDSINHPSKAVGALIPVNSDTTLPPSTEHALDALCLFTYNSIMEYSTVQGSGRVFFVPPILDTVPFS
jgi:hypothetical protein